MYTNLQKTTETEVDERGEFLHGDLSYKINGILIEVYKEKGSYAREKQYCDQIEEKLKEANLEYKRELRIGDSGNILDFLIEDKVVLEVKAVRILVEEHFDQVKRYLTETNLNLGILVNFRTKYLTPRRVLNPNNVYS